ncbi:MAG: PEP-CTERM sorting domain-containing protein [Pseudomonadota bacterium]
MESISKLAKKFLPALAATVCLPTSAHAVLISTSVGDYEVTTVVTDFSSYEDVFEMQVWWGDVALAEEFATLTNTLFGTPNLGIYSPFFWYTTTDTTGPCAGIGESYAGVYWNQNNNRASPVCAASPPNGPYTFAIAQAVDVPEPGVLALMALGMAGIGIARKKRHADR